MYADRVVVVLAQAAVSILTKELDEAKVAMKKLKVVAAAASPEEGAQVRSVCQCPTRTGRLHCRSVWFEGRGEGWGLGCTGRDSTPRPSATPKGALHVYAHIRVCVTRQCLQLAGRV